MDRGIDVMSHGGAPPTNGHGPAEQETMLHLRIALAAPPMETVPPTRYGGTERIVAVLAAELARRGHSVTLIAAGDSQLDCEVIPIVPKALWPAGYHGDVSAYMLLAAERTLQEAHRFDIVHSHLEQFGLPVSRHAPVPVVSTLHGRLDWPGTPELLEAYADAPLVAISASQRRWSPDSNWVATIHHGLPLEAMPWSAEHGDYLVLVGRLSPEKGVAEAVELARVTGLPLKIAAKDVEPAEQEIYRRVIEPALGTGLVEFLGPLGPAERDPLIAGALATLMLGAWPEPFGLVAIESLGCGTPVIARRAGAHIETIEHGVDGYLVDDLLEARLAVTQIERLDRAQIRGRAVERFSVDRMVDQYEAVYRDLVAAERPEARAPTLRPLVTAASS